MHRDTSQPSEQPADSTTTIRPQATGLLLLTSSILLAMFATIYGQHFAFAQFSDPLVDGVVWPIGPIAVALGTLAVTIFTVFIILGVLTSFTSPELFGRVEYTLAGGGGLVGMLLGTSTSIAVWAGRLPGIAGELPSGVGESFAALGVVAVPLGIAFYRLWRPEKSLLGISPSFSDPDQPDPRVVRQKRTGFDIEEGPAMEAAPVPSGELFPSEAESDQPVPENQSQGNREDDGVNTGEFEFNWVTETDVSMDDIGGMEDLKSELQTDVIKPLTTGKEKAEKLDIPLPNIVFYGPPGTGKTYMAKALATELGLPFAKLSGSDIQSKWINESASKISALFEEAKTVAASEGGAIVFLDELDAVLKERSGAGSAHEEDNKVVAEFLNHLQETSEHDIVFIGATNRLDALDEAGIRSGRIDKKIHVGKPDQDAREAILNAQLAHRPHDLTDEQVRTLARQVGGDVVAADLEAIVAEAARSAAFGRDGERITWRDMRTAVADTL